MDEIAKGHNVTRSPVAKTLLVTLCPGDMVT